MRSLLALLAASVSLFFVRPAQAIDVTGTWTFDSDYQGTSYISTNTLTQTGTTISGSGFGGAYTWPISGTINGSSIVLNVVYNELPSYSAQFVGTTDGATMSGSWSSSWSQTGSFTGEKTSQKRPTAIRLLCNRTADLTQANCFATVGDSGAPPRITPTGTVRFTANSGFMTFGDTCQLQPTAYSPGVAGCSAQYTPPAGFPVGAAFPVDAVYEGDSEFDMSATSHELLMASCIGDAQNPCSGAVALEFADGGAIIKNVLKALLSCGGAGIPRSFALPNAAEGNGGSCSFEAEADMDLMEELQEMTEEQWRQAAESITAQQANKDQVLKVIKEIGSKDSAELQSLMQRQLDIAEMLRKANQQYYKTKINGVSNLRSSNGADASRFAKSKTRTTRIPLISKSLTVKSGKQKSVAFRLDKRAKKFADVFNAAGVDGLSINVRLKYSRPGFKKPKKLAATTTVGLY